MFDFDRTQFVGGAATGNRAEEKALLPDSDDVLTMQPSVRWRQGGKMSGVNGDLAVVPSPGGDSRMEVGTLICWRLCWSPALATLSGCVTANPMVVGAVGPAGPATTRELRAASWWCCRAARYTAERSRYACTPPTRCTTRRACGCGGEDRAPRPVAADPVSRDWWRGAIRRGHCPPPPGACSYGSCWAAPGRTHNGVSGRHTHTGGPSGQRRGGKASQRSRGRLARPIDGSCQL